MSFDLHAVVASDATADEMRRRYDTAVVVRLAQRLSLIPVSQALTKQVGATFSEGEDARAVSSLFQDLTPGLLGLLIESSRPSPVAYLEADYFGNAGGQVAAAWSGGQRIFGPKSFPAGDPWPPGGGPIDEALRLVGATVDRPGADEFECVGLNRFRHTQQWLDLPALIERLPEMDLQWRKQYSWADFQTTVTGYTFGLDVKPGAASNHYALMAVGTATLKELPALPPGWHLHAGGGDEESNN